MKLRNEIERKVLFTVALTEFNRKMTELEKNKAEDFGTICVIGDNEKYTNLCKIHDIKYTILRDRITHNFFEEIEKIYIK